MRSKIAFYTDEHVAGAVVKGLQMRGVDVLTCQKAGMLEADDVSHLVLAATDERVIFTQDTDFIQLHNEGMEHAGIAYAPQQAPIGKITSGLMLIWEVMEPEEMINHVEYL